MAEARTKLTPQQKIEKARKALEDLNRGEVNPDGFTEDAVLHGVLLGEVRGRDAIVSALKKQRETYDEFRQEPHAILADADHTVALVNVTMRRGGQEIKAQQVLVVHDNDQGQIRELWAMLDADTMKKLAR
jgi:limonene-1,2-epoxide hydrolase